MFYRIRSTAYRNLQKDLLHSAYGLLCSTNVLVYSFNTVFKFRKCIIEFAVLLKEHCKSPIEFSKAVVEFDKWGVAFVQQVVDFDKCVIPFAQLAAPLDKLNGRYNKYG